MSFTQKKLEVHFSLASDTFNGTANTKIVRELACSAEIRKPGLPAKNSANVRIHGMSGEDMEKLTMLAFRPQEIRNNRLELYAGDENSLSLAFAGDIVSAWADFNSAPDVVFTVEALTGAHGAALPESLLSVPGTAPAVDVFRQLAGEMNKCFIDRGVTASVADLTLSGSPWEKAWRLAEQLRLDLHMDDDELIIAPRGAADSDTVPVWSASTGLKGYPTFGQKGISATSLYDPRVRVGGLVRIESSVPKATGDWRVYSLTHKLETARSGGAWETRVEAACPEGE